jgi:PAS domain S-box-containing protein
VKDLAFRCRSEVQFAPRSRAAAKQIQDELRLSQEEFAKAFQASLYGITISTRDQGLIFEANEAYCRIVGYSLEELVGHSAVELGIITAESRTAMLATVAADGCVHEAENRVFTKAGDTRVVNVSLDPVDVDGIACFLGIMIDITERRRLEDALRVRREALEGVPRQSGRHRTEHARHRRCAGRQRCVPAVAPI